MAIWREERALSVKLPSKQILSMNTLITVDIYCILSPLKSMHCQVWIVEYVG